MSNYTDYPLEETIHFLFTSRQFSTGAPFTLAGTPALAVYEDESLTQITAGVSLGVDHDTVTGLNLATIVATAANGYEAGRSYHIVVTAGTVDSVSVVGEVVGGFTINRAAALRPTIAGRTLDVAATGEAGLDFGNATGSITGGELGVGAYAAGAITAAAIATDAIGAAELAADAVTEIRDAVTGGAYAMDTDANGRVRIVDGTGAGEINTNAGAIAIVDTCTTNTDMRGTDNAALASVVGALTDAAAAGDPTTADTVMQYIKQLVNVLVGTTGVTTFPAAAAPANNVSLAEIIRAIYDDSNELQGDWTDAGRLDAILDSRMAEASINTTGGAVDTVTTVNGLAAGTVTAAAVATGAIDADALSADAGTEIGTAVWASATRTLTAGTNLNDISVADILTTQMTESYATVDTAPTLAQALFMIQQTLGDFTISGTTLTVRNLAGTGAATFTLDDGTNPTALNRAT